MNNLSQTHLIQVLLLRQASALQVSALLYSPDMVSEWASHPQNSYCLREDELIVVVGIVITPVLQGGGRRIQNSRPALAT